MWRRLLLGKEGLEGAQDLCLRLYKKDHLLVNFHSFCEPRPHD